MFQRRFRKPRWFAPFVGVFCCLLCAIVPQKSALTAQDTSTRRTNLRDVIPDVVVQDQNGRSVRFYSDLLKGKVFVIDFTYASCRGTCLVLGKNLAAVQRTLSNDARKEVRFISISIDPANDSPQTLKSLRRSLRAKSGWTFVTGETTSMQRLWRALIGDLPRKGEHSDAILIGDESTGVLERRWGLTPADTLTETIKELLAASRVRRGARLHSSTSSRSPHE